MAVMAITSACRGTGQACGPDAQVRCAPLPEPLSCVTSPNWVLAAA